MRRAIVRHAIVRRAVERIGSTEDPAEETHTNERCTQLPLLLLIRLALSWRRREEERLESFEPKLDHLRGVGVQRRLLEERGTS